MFDSQTFRVVFIRDIPNDTVNDTVKKRLSKELSVVIEYNGATSTQIMEVIEISRPTFMRDIEILKNAGLVDFVGAPKTGKYVLTDLARQKLSGNSN